MARTREGEVLNLPQRNGKNTGRGGVEPPLDETARTRKGEVQHPDEMVRMRKGEVLNLPLNETARTQRGRC